MGTAFASLVAVVVAAFLTPILLHRLRLRFIPVVVGEIIAGLIIGKSGFHLVHQGGQWIHILSTLGFIYLLFLSGLEIDFSVFAGKKERPKLPNGRREPNGMVVALTIFVLILVISYLLSLLFVWSGLIHNVYLMTLVIATISLGIVVPTIKDMGIVKSSVGQMILLITVVGDLMTMVLLAVFVSLFSNKGGSTWVILVLFAAGVLLYFVGKYYRHQSFLETMSKGTIHIDTRAVFALIIVLVGFSKTLGVEIILGSFLAGALVSLLSPDPVMVHKLDSFGYGFLIPIFFVMTGVKLDLWALFSNPSILILMPILFVAFFVAKFIPSLLIQRWYGWRTAFSIGFLVSAKLTLVIAAVRVGQDLHIISKHLGSAIILVSVISCIVGPILFKKLFPAIHSKKKKTRVVIVGANQITLPLSLELDKDEFQTMVFHTLQDGNSDTDGGRSSSFEVKDLADYDVGTLIEQKAFDCDILIASAGNDTMNGEIARAAKAHGIDRVIARIESTESSEKLRAQGIQVFSALFSEKTILKAMVESPSVVDILTTEENGLYQMEVGNHDFAGMRLRAFPFLGDTIIVRIFRDDNSIVPHGDTELKMGDRLIVTGSRVHVEKMEDMLSG